jgi:uncharacterized delta-60 repeat protein
MANINSILSNLNTGYEQVTDLIPDKRVFVDDFDVAKNEYDAYVPGNSPLGSRFIALSGGKYLWVGIDGASGEGNNARNVRRYNADFTLDETFTAPIFSNSSSGFVRDAVEQSDGKIVIIGHFTNINETTTVGKIARLNANGSLDSTFNFEGVGFGNHALVLKLLSDGSFLVGGTFGSYNGSSVNRLVKLNSNGSLNTSFSDNVTLSDDVFAIHVLSSGKIYVGGNFTNKLIRLNSDGTVDETFDVGTGFNNRVSSIEVDSNGKVIVGGWFNEYDGLPCSRGIVRLNTDGTLDTGFETEGDGLNYTQGVVQCLAIQSDGKIVVGGWFNQYDGNRQGHIIRFNTDGTKDSTFVTGYGFGDDGSHGGQRVQDILLDNNKIICVGGLYNYGGKALYGFAKLSSTGSLDPERLFRYVSFGINDGYDDMYDDANFINTNLTQPFDDISGFDGDGVARVERLLSVPNTHSAALDEDDLEDDGVPVYEPAMDGQVMSGEAYFGDDSSYFTNYYPGMYAMVATNINIEEFSIVGDLGSGSSTENDSTILVVHEGATYTVFVKVSRYGSGGESNEPSVNHIIIVPGGQGGLTQTINEDGNDYDDHCIRGLTGRKSIAYLLVARQTSDYISYEDAEAIALKFLEVSGGFSCGGENYELDLSPDNPETNPNYRFNGEGNMDTSVVVDPVTGKRVSIQRTGYFEIIDECGNRRVVSAKDGENLGSTTTTWVDALGSIISNNT